MKRSPSEVFGKMPAGTTHWSARRKGALAWEWCTFAADDGSPRQEFPIATLSLDVIRDRWGSGTYRLMFVAVGRGVRQVSGNGKIFDVTASQRHETPRPKASRSDGDAPEPAGDMVRVLLKAAQGKTNPTELFETLAIPLGMGLSALFAAQDRMNERLDAIERRLTALDAEPTSRAPEVASGAARFDKLLDRLESIEGRLERASVPRRGSPSGRKTPR